MAFCGIENVDLHESELLKLSLRVSEMTGIKSSHILENQICFRLRERERERERGGGGQRERVIVF
jgi:hypothetical protein